MGYGAAELLAGEGANVALLARDPVRTSAKAAQIAAKYGVGAVGISVDAAAGGAGVDDALAEAARRLGPLRGLAVTAGPMKQQGPFDEHGDESWIGTTG
jgi:NAD(P)-dependent dehydrogenase (short-subunit alcohol dehydrogenase family)